MCEKNRRGTREDMAAMAASPNAMSPVQGQPPTDQLSTLMEDPDVWRPVANKIITQNMAN